VRVENCRVTSDAAHKNRAALDVIRASWPLRYESCVDATTLITAVKKRREAPKQLLDDQGETINFPEIRVREKLMARLPRRRYETADSKVRDEASLYMSSRAKPPRIK